MQDEFYCALENQLAKLLIEDTSETKQSLGLPNSYFVASNERVEGFNMPHMYYWDSYFIARGIKNGKFQDYDIGLAENMISLVERLGFVPNSNSFQQLSRSQPPLLAQLVKDLVEESRVDPQWQERAYNALKTEYHTAWVSNQQPHIRRVHPVLSRYYDSNVLHDLAEAESGWDYTNRFDGRALDFLPVDLNCLLATYEEVLGGLAAKFEPELTEKYADARTERIEAINKFMWHEQDQFYYDLDLLNTRQGTVKSLAAYYALFCGVASDEQAASLVERLEWFETDHGLTCTELHDSILEQKQWTAPNGWAPLHFVVAEGLERYGYKDSAKRIAQKWVKTVRNDYQDSGQFKEKYNVIDPSQPPKRGLYPDQVGFGWTNAVTKYFLEKY